MLTTSTELFVPVVVCYVVGMLAAWCVKYHRLRQVFEIKQHNFRIFLIKEYTVEMCILLYHQQGLLIALENAVRLCYRASQFS